MNAILADTVPWVAQLGDELEKNDLSFFFSQNLHPNLFTNDKHLYTDQQYEYLTDLIDQCSFYEIEKINQDGFEYSIFSGSHKRPKIGEVVAKLLSPKASASDNDFDISNYKSFQMKVVATFPLLTWLSKEFSDLQTELQQLDEEINTIKKQISNQPMPSNPMKRSGSKPLFDDPSGGVQEQISNQPIPSSPFHHINPSHSRDRLAIGKIPVNPIKLSDGTKIPNKGVTNSLNSTNSSNDNISWKKNFEPDDDTHGPECSIKQEYKINIEYEKFKAEHSQEELWNQKFTDKCQYVFFAAYLNVDINILMSKMDQAQVGFDVEDSFGNNLFHFAALGNSFEIIKSFLGDRSTRGLFDKLNHIFFEKNMFYCKNKVFFFK